MGHDVFISYSSKDKEVADQVCFILERDGIRCWIAPRDIRPGERYAISIIEAIKACNVFVIVFSNNAVISEHVSVELERAMSKGIPIIPFRIENLEPTGEMEYYLSVRQWLDAFDPPIEQHVRKLASVIKVYMEPALFPEAPERSVPGNGLDTLISDICKNTPKDLAKGFILVIGPDDVDIKMDSVSEKLYGNSEELMANSIGFFYPFEQFQGSVLVLITDRVAGAIVDRLLGGEPDIYESRQLNELEYTALKCEFSAMTDFLSNSWDNVIQIDWSRGSMVTDRQLILTYLSEQRFLKVSLRLKISKTEGFFDIFLPLDTLKQAINGYRPQ